MGLFGPKPPKSYLGIDLGGSSIKLVELKDFKGKPQLVTYGYLEQASSEERMNFIDNPDYTSKMLKQIAKESKVLSNKAITALPAPAVFSSIISLPNVSRKDLTSTKKITAAVQWEAKKVIPLPLEEMILDWKILGNDELENAEKSKENTDEKLKNLQVLITGAAKSLVKKYVDIFKKANLDLLSLETESFALARALVGKDKSTVIIVDIGATSTDIAVIDQGIPYFDRSINIGGSSISKVIGKKLNVDFDQAEQFKRDLESGGMTSQQEPGHVMPSILESAVGPILNEIKYVNNFFLEQPDNAGKSVDKIILSGGSSLLYNLPQYIANELNMRVFIGDPWARVIYPQDLQPVLQQIGPRFATSIGLAMRDIE